MKRLLLIIFFTCSFNCIGQEKLIASCCGGEEGRCTGSSYCTACSNCSRCKHCGAGGTCGVCSSRTTPTQKSSYKSDYSGSSRSVETKKDATYTTNSYLRVTSATLNLREGPGTNYKIIEELEKGALVQYLSVVGDWLIVKVYSSGKVGYINSKYVE